MIYLLVGHRGVGKSSLLERIKEYAPWVQCWDLDTEIVKACGKSIDETFEGLGESQFRRIEKRVFQQTLKKMNKSQKNHYMAVGAGFEGSIPPEALVIWVRRLTDFRGRVFSHRPKLSKKGSEYGEYLKRFKERDQRYGKWAHSELTLIEGLDFTNPWEAVIFNGERPQPKGQLTLLPRNCRSFKSLREFLKIYQPFFTHFELRDDLLSKKQIQWALDSIPLQKLIYSYRKSPGEVNTNLRTDLIDWPLELGEPISSCHLVSLHQRHHRESVEVCCLRLEKYAGKHLKLAIPITNFKELWEAHQWWSEEPENRSFLPCSRDGRWNWYRLRQRSHMKINFVKLGEGGSCSDQPLLLDWLRGLDDFKKFAAILGDPVEHSHTPIEQHEYFSSENMPIFKIKMNETELDSLHVLRNLGLECAAVTSPLKVGITPYCDQLSPIAEKVNSVNTLFWGKQLVGHNTDIEGLKDLFDSISPLTAVWGGAGTRNAMTLVLPKTTPFYSARSGELLLGDEKEAKTLIWAVGRNRHRRWPPHRPQKIIDLNYTEDSPGLEFARNINAEYISGRTMFKTQAKGQRQFWQHQKSTKSVGNKRESL